MGFLDENPFRSDDPVGRKLMSALMDVYYQQPLVQQFANDAGIPLAGIAWTGRMEDVWPELLHKAAGQRLLRTLISRIAAHPEGGAIGVLGPLLAEPVGTAANRVGTASDAYGLHLLGGAQVPRPFIDRVELRRLLRQFTEQDAERVLVVTGEKRTGKSYSWHLIRHIGFSVTGVEPFRIDLGDWVGPPMGPYDVMESVAMRLALDGMPPRESLAQEDAQAWKLRVWFLGQMRRLEVPCWLVLDGLDRAPLTESARRLIIAIVEATKNNEAGRLRIALLAGPRPDADDFQVLHDEIRPVPLHELRTFFDQASTMTGGGILTDDGFDRLLKELFGESAPPESLCLEQVGPRAARLASSLFFAGRAGHG
jgi:Effector-associated domain 1